MERAGRDRTVDAVLSANQVAALRRRCIAPSRKAPPASDISKAEGSGTGVTDRLTELIEKSGLAVSVTKKRTELMLAKVETMPRNGAVLA